MSVISLEGSAKNAMHADPKMAAENSSLLTVTVFSVIGMVLTMSFALVPASEQALTIWY